MPKLLKMKNTILSTLAFLCMIAVNALANILPINGLNTGEVSALYPSLFTPAGITFSIWSIIYLLLLGFIAIQWIKSDAYVFSQISSLFWFSCLLNCAWILCWHYLLTSISVTIMLLLLLTLLQIFIKTQKISMTSTAEKIFIRLPFTIYFAWICVATIANISTYLVSIEWSGLFWSSKTWTILMMTVASLLAIVMTTRFRSPSFSLVICWALLGIFSRWNDTEQQLLAYTAFGLMLTVGINAFITWRKTKFGFA